MMEQVIHYESKVSDTNLISEESSSSKGRYKQFKKNKKLKEKNYEKLSENSDNSSRIISSRGESRLLFGDINIDELQ